MRSWAWCKNNHHFVVLKDPVALILYLLMTCFCCTWSSHIYIYISFTKLFQYICCFSCLKAVPQLRWLVAGFPLWRPVFDPRSSHVGQSGGQSDTGQAFSGNLSFPCQFSFPQLLHTHHLSAGSRTIGQIVADIPSGLSLTQPQENFVCEYDVNF
jgi:hypothetical protein